MAKPRNMDNHRDDIPGLPGNAAWCNACQNYCGGDGSRCACCGGKATGERQQSAADVAQEQSGVPVAGGTQVSPSAGPGHTDMDQEGNRVGESAAESDAEPESKSGRSRRGRRLGRKSGD